MGIITSFTWVCDLCKNSLNAKSETEGPDGWIKISVEDAIADRLVHNKVICKSCIYSIVEAKNKIPKQQPSIVRPGGGCGIIA